jgi:hypothetical protein
MRVVSLITNGGTSIRLARPNKISRGFTLYSCVSFCSVSAGPLLRSRIIPIEDAWDLGIHSQYPILTLDTPVLLPISSIITLQLFSVNGPKWTTPLPLKSQYLHPQICSYEGLRLPVALVRKDVQVYVTPQMHVLSHTTERPWMVAEGVTGTTAGCMTAMGADESEHADIEDLDEVEGIDDELLNTGVCKIVVEGIVHEVEGDEEGLITTNPTSENLLGDRDSLILRYMRHIRSHGVMMYIIC